MKHTIRKMLGSISPRLEHAAINTYNSLSGRGMYQLRRSVDDIASMLHRLEHLSLNSENMGRIAAINSLAAEALQSTKDMKTKRLAVIAPLPPSSTGIANFTLETFTKAEFPVDIFSNFDCLESYLYLSSEPSFKERGVRFFSLETLLLAMNTQNYVAKLYEIGNSNHIVPMYKALKYNCIFKNNIPNLIHLHDPALWNFYFSSRYLYDGIIRTDALKEAYNLDFRHLDCELARGNYSILKKYNVYGIKGSFFDKKIDGFIVNSKAAKEILMQDWPELDSEEIHTLFHPVFPVSQLLKKEIKNGLRIGTFGVPHEGKGTDLVIEAFGILQKSYPTMELLISGYDANKWFASQKYDIKNISISDSPTNEQLLQQMSSCDLAVQLRRGSYGESSGVVPQLLSVDTPVITSPVGAFSEYGAAVAFLQEWTAPQLAHLIEKELKNSGVNSLQRQQYIKMHTPELFCSGLMEIANSVTARDRKLES